MTVVPIKERAVVAALEEGRRSAHEGARLWRTGQARLGREAASRAPRRHRRRRPDHDHHHLRHRPPHPERRRAGGHRGAHPRPRRRRGDRGRGCRGDDLPQGRPRARLVHHLLRRLSAVPEGDVLALPHGRLAPRPHHRRHPGRVRAHSARRREPPSPARRPRRRGARDAERHLSHRVRGRRPERPGPAGRHGRDRRRRARRPGGAAHGAALLALRDHRGRHGRAPPPDREHLRRHARREQLGRPGRDGRARPHGRRRRGRGDRGRGRAGDVRPLPVDRGAGRPHRQRGRARQAGPAPPGDPVVAERHDHHGARGHELDAPPAEDGAVGKAPAGPARHPSLPAGAR